MHSEPGLLDLGGRKALASVGKLAGIYGGGVGGREVTWRGRFVVLRPWQLILEEACLGLTAGS